MLRIIELLNIQGIVLKFDHGSFIVVDVAVVGGREDGDDDREVGVAVPAVHLVAIELGLVRPDDRDQVVALEEAVDGVVPVEVAAPPHVVDPVDVLANPVVVVDGVGPEQVAEDPLPGGFLKSIDLLYIFK